MEVAARFTVFLFVLALSGLDACRGDTAFFNSGYMHVNSSVISSRLRAEVQFKRQGTSSDQVLFLFHSATPIPDYFAVVLRNGQLMSILRFGDAEVEVHTHSELAVPALHWHRLVINLRRTSLALKLPDVSNTSTRNIQGFNKRSFPGVFTQFYLGGIPNEKHGLFPDLPTFVSFQGCMRSLLIMTTEVNFHSLDENRLDSFRVESGNCCVEASSCPMDQPPPVTIPSSCPLSRFNFSWSEITVIAQHVQVSEGGMVVLDANILTVDVPEGTAEVWVELEPLVHKAIAFQLDTPPRHGSLRKNGSAEKLGHFDYQTLAMKSILYSHNGSETTRDSFTLRMSLTCEGYVILSRLLVFQVVIQPQNDPPLISRLSSLRLAVGTRRTLTPSIISVTDPDSELGRISFEVPKLENGRFERAGRAGESITRFYQEDLFNGTVAFQHAYSTGVSPFTILIIISDGVATKFEHLTVQPYEGIINVVNRTCLKVIEGSMGTLQSRHLGIATNFEDQNPEVQLILQSVASYGAVQLLVASEDIVVWQTLNEGDSFSRQDIQSNRVRYLQNSSSYGADISQQQDELNVTVMSYEAPGPSVHQCIEVIPKSFLEQSRLELVTSVLNLTEGGAEAVGPQNIEISLLPASLMEWLHERGGLDSIGLSFSITVFPQHGSITLNKAPLNNTSFTLSHISSSLLVYRHDGSEEHNDELAFLVEATEIEPADLRIHPLDAINGVFPIFIAPVNNHRPVVEAHDITPLEGGSQVVDQSVLSITDLDKPGDVIWIMYERNQYDNGYFAFVSNFSEVVTKFTAEDVQARRVIFHHRFGDVLTRPYVFNITDGEHWLQKGIKVRASPPILNVSIADGDESTCPFMFDASEQLGYRLHPEFFIISTNAPGRRPDIKITVVVAPQHGYLYLEKIRLRENSVFEMRQVDSDIFLYILRNRTVQMNQDRFSLQFELGSTTTVLDVPICIDPVPVPELESVYSDLDSLRLRVPFNGIQVITNDLLQATDSRGGLFPGGLGYNIAIPPQYGRIVNRSRGEEEVHRFSQADVNSQHIAYIHDQPDDEETDDYFTFKLHNKYFTLAPVRVTVDLYHTNLSVTNDGFSVTEGDRHIITADEFYVSAPPGYSVYVAIVTPPLHGDLLYGSRMMPLLQRVITPSDLSSGLLSYAHDSSESVFDSFVFEVTANVTDPVTRNMYDGVAEYLGNFLGVVNITVDLINDNRPEPHITSGLLVWEGSTAIINTSILSFRDRDINYNASNLNYTVNDMQPSIHCGHLYFVERPHVAVTSFLQADLEAGRLWYKNDRTKQCISSGQDSIEFIFYTVSDGGLQSNNLLRVNIVSFIITPVNKGLMLKEGAQAIIPPTALSASVQGNAEIAPSEFLFIITQPPQHGVLMVAASPVEESISLEDIEKNKLAYIHDGSDTIKDAFQFDISVRNFTEAGQMFDITIESVDDTPPVVLIQQELRVLERGKGYFNQRHLLASDLEQPPNQLRFSVVTRPHYGTIYRTLHPYDRSEVVHNFTQREINNEVIFYENTRAGLNWRDNLTLFLTDGRNLLEEQIRFNILLMPRMLPIRRNKLVVLEGGLCVIRTENLMVSHPVYVGLPTNYTVTRQPVFGVLHSIGPARSENTITTFTQTSIDNRYIVYAHQGRESISDKIGLKAISTEDNLSSGEFFLAVEITPVNDEEPILSNPYPDLMIWNGDTVYVSADVLQTTDEDNPPEELLYTYNRTAESGVCDIGHFAWSHNRSFPIFTFSQWNVTREEVVFVHRGCRRNATLSFSVSEGVHTKWGNLTIVAKPIIITLSKNVPVFVKMEENKSLLHSLEAVTNDGREHVITFTVTAECQYGRLLRDGSEVLGVGSRFTQQDINGNRIAYLHTDMDRWVNEDHFQFQVYVQFAVQPLNGSFVIKIRLRQSLRSSQPYITPLLVKEGGHACFNESHLDARNLRYRAWKNHSLTIPIESLKISYSVVAGPKYGKLGIRGRIRSDSSNSDSANAFAQDGTDRSYSCYFHDGSDSTLDRFIFDVNILPDTASIGTDSLFHSTGIFEIHIEPVNDERPFLDEEASLEVVIVDGFVGVITNHQLRVVDPDTPPERLEFCVGESPRGVRLLLGGTEEAGVQCFTQSDIDNTTVKLLHDGLSQVSYPDPSLSFHLNSDKNWWNGRDGLGMSMSPSYTHYVEVFFVSLSLDPVQFSFQFTDGNRSHIGNGTITIVIVPRQLNFTGTAHLVYRQDAERVLISTSVLDVWTNVLRSETIISVDSVPMSGVIRKNLTSEAVESFLQTDIDNGQLFYYPTNVSAFQDAFTLTLANGKQRIHKTVKVTVVSRTQLNSITLSSSLNTLNYILPANLFHTPDGNAGLNPHFTVTTNPRYGELSKQSGVTKRQLTQGFAFTYSELLAEHVVYTVDKTLQNDSDYIVEETFEVLVQMTPGGQPGVLAVTFAVEVSRTPPQTSPPTVTQDPLLTGNVAASSDNTLIVIPVLGVAVVLVAVIGIVVAAMIVRCHRLKEKERRRKERKAKEQKSNQSNESGQLPPTADYITPNAEDTNSESTIDGDVTATEKQFPPPPQTVLGTHSETSFVYPHHIEQNGVVDSSGLPPYSQHPISLPLPERQHHGLTSVYSQRGSPRRSPSARAAARKKLGLTYNTSAIDSDVKKLFRSDYPQLKHVEYWV